MKLSFMEQYMKLKDKTIIEKLSNILNEEVSKIKRIPVSKSERQAIREGMKDIEEGNTHTHEQVMAKMREKYPNLIK
jgi:predicted transcriptional regulator